MENLRQQLGSVGLRRTPARIHVLEQLRHGPQTHRQLADQLSPLGFDPATVFRTLQSLISAGLAARACAGGPVWTYTLKD